MTVINDSGLAENDSKHALVINIGSVIAFGFGFSTVM